MMLKKSVCAVLSVIAGLPASNLNPAPVTLYGIDSIQTLSNKPQGVYVIQVGVFRKEKNATDLVKKLSGQYRHPVSIKKSNNGLFIVLIGPIKTDASQVSNNVNLTQSGNTVTSPSSNSDNHTKTTLSRGLFPHTIRQPKLTGQGLWGNNQQGSGFVDVLTPVWGLTDSMFFTDGFAMLGRENRNLFSIGTGYRQISKILNNSGIFGIFGFGDWYQSEYKQHVWVANPGMEWFTSKYELRAQGYFPLSNKRQAFSSTTASEIPLFHLNDSGRGNIHSRAVGNTLIDAPVFLTQDYGNGFEAEGGVHLPWLNGGWLRGGVYGFYYDTAKDIHGAVASLQMFINRNASIVLQNNYDNQNKNKFSLGLIMSFGGDDLSRPQILENRMQEPIRRHIARQSYGAVMPTRLNYQLAGDPIVFDNVFFFSQNGTPAPAMVGIGSCTAQNPCSTPNQATVDQISAIPSAYFVFASGTYNLTPQTNPFLVTNFLKFYDGQTVLGRSADYRSKVSGNDRPLVNGTLFWGDNSVMEIASGAVYDMRVNADKVLSNAVIGQGGVAVVAVGATNHIKVSGSELYSIDTASTGEPEVLAVQSLGTATIDNSVLNAKVTATNVASPFSFGVRAKQIVMTNSSVSASATAVNNTQPTSEVVALRAADMTLANSNVTASAVVTGSGKITVKDADNFKSLTATHSTMTASGQTNSGNISVQNLRANGPFPTSVTLANTSLFANLTTISGMGTLNNVVSANNVTITGGTFVAHGTSDSGQLSVRGISGQFLHNIDGATVNVSATSNSGNATATGINVTGGSGNIQNSSITASSSSNSGTSTATGVLATGTGTTVTNTQIEVSATTAKPCDGNATSSDGSCSG